MQPLLTIGELSQRSGVATSALRFYEERGLLAAERSRAGHRRYRRDVLRRVAFIVFAQRVGLTLEEIGEILADLPASGPPTGHDWAQLSGQWAARIDERILELQRLRTGLTACIGCGCLSLDHCRLANPGDRASTQGPGPRFLMVERGCPSARAPVRRATK